MSTATVTSKGQITIPSTIRSALNVVAGDRVEFVRTADDRFEVVAVTQEVGQMRGMIKAKRTVSIDEMNQSIRAKAGQS
jgi:AbrB family looped-hinge helix DNA binding protein